MMAIVLMVLCSVEGLSSGSTEINVPETIVSIFVAYQLLTKVSAHTTPRLNGYQLKKAIPEWKI